MSSNIKNIIMFVSIGVVLVLVYIFFLKPSPETATLVSSSSSVEPSLATSESSSPITQEFLSLLLSVKSIKLDGAIFSDNTFSSLNDSSITLIPDGNEGRPNPFAPLGTDNIVLPVNSGSSSPETTGVPVLP